MKKTGAGAGARAGGGQVKFLRVRKGRLLVLADGREKAVAKGSI